MNSIYGTFRTRKFTDIYPDFETFKNDYNLNKISSSINVIKEDSLSAIYYLLYARFGNSTIANNDENQFKYKVYSNIFMYGPAWEKEITIQNELRALSVDDIVKGSKVIYNHAFNPGTGAENMINEGTNTEIELKYINEQNTNTYKKSKLEGYSQLLALLKRDVTRDFIDKFKNLFIVVVEPNKPLYYTTIVEGDEQ